mgnify:CR=1 FL=1
MSNPKLELLTPSNSQVIFIDQQPQMAFGVQSIDRQTLKNNVVGLATAARAFNIPTIITTVETESFSGNTYPELLDVFPDAPLLERTSMNSWDDQKVRDALAKNGRKKVIVSGLWTEVCNCTFALSAMLEGDYEIYMVVDASGGTSEDAHKYAMDRMVQAGVVLELNTVIDDRRRLAFVNFVWIKADSRFRARTMNPNRFRTSA